MTITSSTTSPNTADKSVDYKLTCCQFLSAGDVLQWTFIPHCILADINTCTSEYKCLFFNHIIEKDRKFNALNCFWDNCLQTNTNEEGRQFIVGYCSFTRLWALNTSAGIYLHLSLTAHGVFLHRQAKAIIRFTADLSETLIVTLSTLNRTNLCRLK